MAPTRTADHAQRSRQAELMSEPDFGARGESGVSDNPLSRNLPDYDVVFEGADC
jgi:hypothetical protein